MLLNKIQTELVKLIPDDGKSITAEALNLITPYTVVQIKHNLNRVVKMEIGICEESFMAGGKPWSGGYYKLNKINIYDK